MIIDEHSARDDAFLQSHLYTDQSIVCVMPTRGQIPARVYDSHMSLMRLPNQKWTQVTIANMEVSAAYEWAAEMILADPNLSQWRWMLTIEEDNIIPPDAVIRLVKAASEHNYDVLGALYWVKGEGGVPQIWGDASDPVENYRPQPPVTNAIVDCYGTGMGCTLFSIDLLRRLAPPRFLCDPAVDGMFTQDLKFASRLHAARLDPAPRIGVHCGVKVGHFDYASGTVW